MKDNFLSQEEIDALFSKKDVADDTSIKEIEKEEDALENGQENIQIRKPVFSTLEDKSKPGQENGKLELIMDIPLEISVVLGKTKKTIKEILSLGIGSIVELDKLTDEPLEIYTNGKLIAKGEVVVINENFGIKITQIISKERKNSIKESMESSLNGG